MTAATTHPVPYYRGPLRTTWRLFGSRRSHLAAGIALRFAQAFCAGASVSVMVWVVDRVRVDALTGRQAVLAAVLTVLSVVGQYGFGYASNYFAWVSTFEAIGETRIGMLAHVQRLPLGVVANRGVGDIGAALSTDLETVSNFAHHGMPTLFGAIGLPLVVLVSMLFIDPPLAVAVFLSIVAGVPAFLITNHVFKAVSLERGDRLAAANTRIVEYVHGIGVLRAFNRTGERQVWFRDAVRDIRRVNDAMAVKLTPLAYLFIGTLLLGVPVVIGAASYWLFGGRIDVGTAIVFLILVLRVYAPLIQVGMQFEALRLADASLVRIGRVMDLAPQAAVAEPIAVPDGDTVELAGVSFGYDGEARSGDGDGGRDGLVLHDVSLRAPAGSMTAIVGPSGSGKTTILNLVARFWDPQEGRVCIGGVDVRDLTPDQLFDSVAVVFQDVYLFQGTIRDNIAFGRSDATDEQVRAAARAAQIDEFVRSLPDGYDTRIGEGGSTLSGGERQRVSIARAILKDAPVVLLDEATASIDPINERAVQAALAELVRGRTLLVVAHRLSTIRSADHIVVVERGRIVQRGTHDELVAVDGLYRHLWTERQRASSWQVGGGARRA